MEPSRKPLNLLVKKLNAEVSIRLKNDVEYRGRMIDADSHMNILELLINLKFIKLRIKCDDINNEILSKISTI